MPIPKEQLNLNFPSQPRSQHPLFPPANKYDSVVRCSACGQDIVTRRYAGDAVESEFISRDGRCYYCTTKD
jgi:hypothetical protein